MAEHNIRARYHIYFIGTSILHRASGYMGHLINEAVQIQLNKNNLNRDCDYILSRAWDLVTNMLTSSKIKHSKHLTLPTSTWRLVTNYKPGFQACV
jgi:hypothetical protein